MINNNSTFGIEEAQKLIDKFSETLAQRGIPTLSISDKGKEKIINNAHNTDLVTMCASRQPDSWPRFVSRNRHEWQSPYREV